jgi:putative membrane protein
MESVSHRAHPVRCAIGAFLLSVALQASAHDEPDFLKQAVRNGEAEIAASKMAETKSASPEIQAFAKAMVADHTKVAEELKALAAKKRVELPENPSFL